MFFEATPRDATPERPVFEFPAWVQPPDAEIGAVLAVERVAARSPNAVVLAPTVRAYSTGCMVNVEVRCRQGDLDPDAWWELQYASWMSFPARGGVQVSDRLLRLGVRYRDGAKVTTLDQPRWRTGEEPPAGPVLSASPQSSGGRSGASVHNFGLWLWPLPPAEPFEFAAEWPFAGIDLTIVELDGAAIGAAAARSARYWS